MRVGLAPGLQRDQVGKIGVATGAFSSGGHGQTRERNTLADTGAFVIGEEESLVFDDAAAGCGAELILLKRPFALTGGVQKEVGGIEFIVAQKLPGTAVKAIAAGFDTGIQDSAARAPEFRAERVCLQA